MPMKPLVERRILCALFVLNARSKLVMAPRFFILVSELPPWYQALPVEDVLFTGTFSFITCQLTPSLISRTDSLGSLTWALVKPPMVCEPNGCMVTTGT